MWRWLCAALKGQPVPPLLVALGLRDGTLLDVLDAHAPQTRVLALEPDTLVWHRTMGRPHVDKWKREGRLLYLAGPAYAGAEDAWRLFPAEPDGYKLVIDPGLSNASPGNLEAARILKRIVFGAKANADARARFAPRYLLNSLRNLPAIVSGADVRDLTGAYRGVPAIVAGAGPSLDAAIAQLQTMPGRGLLVAADTALRPLLAGGLAPHLVVGLDPGAANARHFLELPECRDTWLVSESALDRRASDVFADRTFWFRVAHHHPWPWLNELGVDVGRLDVWGSVLTGALQVALLAGCDPIVVVGADLAFTNGRPYARGTTYEFDWAHAVASGHALADTWQSFMVKGEPARDLRGNTTNTTRSMGSVRDWIVAWAGRSGRQVINASGDGTLFGRGIERATLADVLRQQVSIEPVSRLAHRRPQLDRVAMAARVRAVREQVASNAPDALLAQWKEFSGTGFNSTEVDAALDEAVRGLDAHPGARTATTILPWQNRDTATVMMRVLPRLPETIGQTARTVAGDAGVADRDCLPDPTRVESLLSAWDVLGRICNAVVQQDDDLQLSIDAASLGTTAVSTAYAWPDVTRWAVVMFEGLLRDGRGPERPEERAFCARPMVSQADLAGLSTRPHASFACAWLGLDWLRAVGIAPAICDVIAHSLRADAVRVGHDAAAGISHRSALSVEPGVNEMGNVELRLSFNTPTLALMRTGLLDIDDGATQSIASSLDLPALLRLLRADAPVLSAALAARVETSSGGVRAQAVRSDYLPIRPRVLTQEGAVNRLFIAYRTSAGTVCVRPHTTESVLIDERGSMTPYRSWPRLIGGQLPLGETGTLAWSQGLSKWPDIEPAYVMYQRRPEDDVTIEELPFRPAYGKWWNGRVYWTCFSIAEGWQGLVSWAPGESPREEASGMTLWATFPEGDDLVLHPCDFTPSSGFRRQIHAHGLVLRSGHEPASVPLGPYGSMSSIDTNGAWTAAAHPDSDIVRVTTHDGGSLLLGCPCPLGVSWIGGSLLVGTLQGEILLFEDLLDALERASPREDAA